MRLNRGWFRVCMMVACVLCPLLSGQAGYAQAGYGQAGGGVRVSSWYWLNSTDKAQWPRDFKAMKDLGLTDVVLVWGLDAVAFSTRVGDSHEAMRAAYKAGLGSYLFVWHARHSALPHQEQFQQVDAGGHVLFAFDVFNREWRETQWKRYLQTLAREYGHEPGMAGYVFDNSFAIGNIGAIDGPAPSPAESYLSYGKAEAKMFGRQPPTSPEDPAWGAWTEARQEWWAQWAKETRAAIRAIDPDPRHEIVLEDGENTIDPDAESRAGFTLGRVTSSFDTMTAYWAPRYSKDSAEKIGGDVRGYLARMRTAIGTDKPLGFTLRLSDDATEDLPGHADHPTLEQVEGAVDAALAAGVRHIDLYGYRMGIYHLDGAGWRHYQPGTGREYPLTGQVEGKFLADRPELRDGLKAYLKKIETEGRPHASR